MAVPGIIERPLLADEFSIYLDNTRPIPLSALATFLGKLDKAARSVRGMEGLFLELSDFALGSNELRCRIVGPGRLRIEEAARQERLVKATEGSARATKVAAGAAVVSAVAAVVALAITSGNANPPASRITQQYNVSNFYVRAPNEPPHVITRKQIEEGRQQRLATKARSRSLQRDAESETLLAAMHDHKVVNLGGWFYQDPQNGYLFETMNGNRFPVHFRNAQEFEGSAVALQAIVHDSPDGLQLEVIEVLATLADY